MSVAERLQQTPIALSCDEFADLADGAQTASGRPWRLAVADESVAAAVAERIGGSLALGRILAARGVGPDDAAAFVNPTLRDTMPDPFALADMEAAAARLARAVTAGERVGLFGDYDVDGSTAAAIFKLYFDAIGADLSVYLPDRLLEGYGPTEAAFEALRADGADLIVTVDCGAAATDPIAAMARQGVDVVVFDHHQMPGPPPAGAVCVNPHRPDDRSGLDMLSAAGLAFMAVVALNRALRKAGWFKDRPEPDCRRYLDLAALGLVCDVMPMRGLARVMVAQGLKLMAAGRGNPGLAALAEIAGASGPPSAYQLGFSIGPRINAAGRIGHAKLAFDLMTTDDAGRRDALANQLHTLNAERQEIERCVETAAIAAVEAGDGDNAVAVAVGEGWHPGVVGIVAGRLKDRLDKPAIVIGLDGDIGKGSGRSIPGVDLGAAVADLRAKGFLIAGGGHAMAAGLTIARRDVEAFSVALNSMLGRDVDAARAGRIRRIDAVVAASAVSSSFANEIARAGPFGPGAPEPVFVCRSMAVAATRVVGRGHVACTLYAPDGAPARAVAFRADQEPLGEMLQSAAASGARLSLAGKIIADAWRGGDAGEFHIIDAAPA